MFERAQQRLMQTIKCKKSNYLCKLDSYRDAIIIVISKLLSIVIVIVLLSLSSSSEILLQNHLLQNFFLLWAPRDQIN